MLLTLMLAAVINCIINVDLSLVCNWYKNVGNSLHEHIFGKIAYFATPNFNFC